MNIWSTFPRANFSTTDTSHTFCRSATKFGTVMCLANQHLLPKFDELWPTLSGVRSFDSVYLAHHLPERDKIWQRWGLTNWKLFPEFRELWSGGSVIQCGNMHQSFIDTLVKLFFDNFPMHRLEHGAECTARVKRSLSCLSQLYETPTLSVDR